MALPRLKTSTRRRLHFWSAVFFAIQIPPAIILQGIAPRAFEVIWRPYLIFLSLAALVIGHLSAVSAELPTEPEDEHDGS